MVRMGLVGDEYRPMRRRFLKRLPGDSATKAGLLNDRQGDLRLTD